MSTDLTNLGFIPSGVASPPSSGDISHLGFVPDGSIATPPPETTGGNPLMSLAKGAANLLLGPAVSLGTHLAQAAAGGTANVLDTVGVHGEAAKIRQNLSQPFSTFIGSQVDPLKSGMGGAGQIAGDAAQNALFFTPGLGETGGFLSNLAKGAAFGYGQGSASELSAGKSLPEAILPNTSNVVGAVTGGAVNTLIPKITSAFTQKGAVQGLTDNLTSELKRTVPTRTLMGDGKGGMGSAAAKRAIDLIASVPEAVPRVGGNTFEVNEAIDALHARIAQLGQARAEAIQAITPEKGISLDTLAAQAKRDALTIPGDAAPGEQHTVMQRMFSGQSQKMLSQIDAAVADIKAATGKTYISAPELEAMKESQTAASKVFKYTGSTGDANGASMLGNAAKEKIEDLAKNAGFPGMQEYNQYIKDHYNAVLLLQRLGKQTVQGGRLAKILAGHTAATIAALAANAAGGGFLGTITSAAAGEGTSHMLSKILTDQSISNPLRDAILRRIEQEDPAIVKQLMQFAGKSGEVAPKLAPTANTMGSMVPALLTQGATRAAVAGTQ